MQNIEQTEWACRFKAAAPYQYEEALEIAQRLKAVVIERRDDHGAKGDFLWAIVPDVDPDFWLDAAPTRTEAESICASTGWPIKEDMA